MWGFEKVDVWGCVRKVRVFEFGYVRVDVWGKFIEICEWCDGCKKNLIFFKCIKCKFTNLPLSLKIFWIIKYEVFLHKFELIKIL